MYQLMTLETPFENSNSDITLKRIADEDYSLPPIEGNYSEELKQIVYKVLEKNQYQRIHIEELCENPLFLNLI
jgi:hypothetical protein